MRDRLTTCIALRGQKVLGPDRWHTFLIYALRGEVQATVNETTWTLSTEQGPLMVVNQGRRAEVSPSLGALAVVIQIDMRTLRRSLNDRAVTFSCNPSLRHQASYGELRKLTEELLRADTDRGDFASIHRDGTELAFVRCLLDGFGGVLSEEPSRSQAFTSYVDAHFDEPLTLADAARHFHLSSEYFSKAFKAETGHTFHAYLTETRLDEATHRLLSGDDTVGRIAHEAGFPNMASFSQAFKARYETTPTAYRSAHVVRSERALPASVVEALEESEHADGSDGTSSVARVRLNAHGRTSHLRSPWRDSVGIGDASSLSDARVRDQVCWLQERLGFGHLRISVDFGRCADGKGLYELENCFNFLVGKGIIPHVVIERDRQLDAQSHLASLSAALRYFINRYSIKTVGFWRFELRIHSWEHDKGCAAYLSFFQQVSTLLKTCGVQEPLIGPGLFLDQDADNLRRFLVSARELGISLPLVSIGGRPAAPAKLGDNKVLVRTADPRYLRNQILLAREVMSREGFGSSKIVVGRWRDSLERKNIMNDSCYEGARIMQTAFSVWDQVESLCYDDALDFAEEGAFQGAFLSGTPGLLSRDGIPKPSYYAFDFLSRLSEQLVYADESILVTTNDMGNFQAVCHNCKRLNAAYLATPEELLDYQLMGTYFEELGQREVKVRIEGLKPGTYLIKKRFVNDAGGSLGDEAERMRLWCMDAPSRAELEHLRTMACPQMRLERHVVTDGVLEFSHTLQGNEIAYLHIIYLY